MEQVFGPKRCPRGCFCQHFCEVEGMLHAASPLPLECASFLTTIQLQFFSSACAEAIQSLRAKTSGTKRLTEGLPLDLLKPFHNDAHLNRALADAHKQLDVLMQTYGRDFVVRDEAVVSQDMQKGFVNFYGVFSSARARASAASFTPPFSDPGALMPYIPLAARGPWIITLHGAVVHDNGGYGDKSP